MGQINIDDADNAAMTTGPTQGEFNILVSKVNEIIVRIESLPNRGCSIIEKSSKLVDHCFLIRLIINSVNLLKSENINY